MKKIPKIISLALIVCMIFATISIVASAEERSALPEITLSKDTPEIVKEITSLRTEYSKTFLMSDGSSTVAEYETPVHYIDDNDEWQDIDNSLKASGDEYINADSNVEAAVSKTLDIGKTISVSVDGYDISWGFVGANRSKGVVSNQEQHLSGNDSFLNLTNLTSKTTYTDAFDNVDAEYIVTSSGVKENIILKNSAAQNEFSVKYIFNGLSAEKVDDRTVELKDSKENVIYTITAPVMTDNNGDTSDDLSFSIVSQSSTELILKLTVSDSWLKTAAYPVNIDPNVEISTENNLEFYRLNTTTGIDDSNLFSGDISVNGETQKNYLLAYTNTRPNLPIGAAIKSACLYLPYSYFGGNFELYKVDASNASSMSISAFNQNKSQYALDSYDCSVSSLEGTATFNITSSAQELLTSGYMTLAIDSGESNYYPNLTTSTLPHFTLRYDERSGINEKYSYHTQSVGRAGSVYINDFTQKMTVLRTDFSLNATDLAASVAMVYAPKYNPSTASPYDWRNIYEQTIVASGSGADAQYVWQNGNGEIIYFLTSKTKDGVTYYNDNQNLGYIYYPTAKKLVSEKGDVYLFSPTSVTGAKLRLTGISSSDYEQTDDAGNISYDKSIAITYTSNGSIDTVTDGDGNIYKYTYGTNRTVSVYDSSDTSLENPLDSVAYTTYSSGRLNTVNYHGEISSYTYSNDSSKLLKKITAPSGYGIEYTYAPFGNVTSLTEKTTENSRTVIGNSLNITFKNGKTTYTDSNGDSEIYVFDDNGNVIAIMNEDGLAINRKNDNDGNLLGSTDVTIPVVNLLNNSSLESGFGNWSGTNNSISTDVTYVGGKSAKITGNGYIERTINVTPNKTYTFSAYSLAESIGTNGYSLLKVSFVNNGTSVVKESNKILQNKDQWQRMTVSFDVPQGVSEVTLRVEAVTDEAESNIAKASYYDAFQLEAHKTSYEYNLIENSDFSSNSNWTYNDGSMRVNNSNDIYGGLDNNSVKLTGTETNVAEISQDIKVNGTVNSQYTLSAWVKPQGMKEPANLPTGDRFAKLAVFELSNGSAVGTAYTFDIPYSAQGNWYRIADTITLDAACDTLRIKVLYSHQSGVLFVDGMELNLGGFVDEELNEDESDSETETTTTETTEEVDGVTLSVKTEKDADNNIISITKTDPQDREVYYFYDGETTISDYETTSDDSPVIVTTRDSSGNIISQTKTDSLGRDYYSLYDGVVTEYEYYGDTSDVTSEVQTADGIALKTLTSFASENNNQRVTTTDTVGNITSILTNEATGSTIQSVDGNNNQTNFVYDELKNLTALIDESTNRQNTYTYLHENISTITTPAGVVYSFTYNGFGDVVSIKVGNTPLVTYTYLSAQNRQIDYVTYGNGQVLDYDYTDNLLSKISCGTSLDEDYYYSELGALLKTKDNVNGTVTTSSDDSIFVWNLNESELLYSYKTGDADYSETIGNNKYSTSYTSNEATASEQANETTAYDGNSKVTYTDKFGRISQIVTKHGDAVLMTQNYSYTERVENGETLSSYQVESITTTIGSVTTTESYEYDANGNITKIYSQTGNGTKYLIRSYSYDSLNQLSVAQEYQQNGSDWLLFNYSYSYNDSGDIEYIDGTVSTYDPSTNSVVNCLSSYRNSYAYSDNNWKDKLTGYGNSDIIYDNAGNPTTYRGDTLVWGAGRQLLRYNSYTYKYDSSGLRTQKTVGSTVYNYIWADGKLVNQSWGNSNLHFYYEQDGDVIGFDYNGEKYSYVKNSQDDIVGVIDASGNVVASYSYDTWGALISSSGSLAEINPLRYRGYYYDSETGMYYLQSRYYDPSLKRFINADVYCDTGTGLLGTNMFAYCENNAVNKIDVDGHIATSILVYKIIGNLAIAFGANYIGNYVADVLGITGIWKGLFVGAITMIGSVASSFMPTLTLKYLALKAALWAAGSSFLTAQNYPIARMLYSHGIWGDGQNLSSNDNNKLSKALTEVYKNNETYRQYIKNQATKLYNAKKLNKNKFTAIEKPLTFTKNSKELDLYYAIHGTTYTGIKGEYKNKKFKLTIRIKDIYDFLPWQEIKGFGSVANDLGCLMQCTGFTKSYKIDVTFSCEV